MVPALSWEWLERFVPGVCALIQRQEDMDDDHRLKVNLL